MLILDEISLIYNKDNLISKKYKRIYSNKILFIKKLYILMK